MASKWTTRRPPLRLYCSWDGNNIDELRTKRPDWTFTENPDGTLHASNTNGEFGDISQGQWFCEDAVYDGDPTLTDQVQDAPGPGLVSFDLTGE